MLMLTLMSDVVDFYDDEEEEEEEEEIPLWKPLVLKLRAMVLTNSKAFPKVTLSSRLGNSSSSPSASTM